MDKQITTSDRQRPAVLMLSPVTPKSNGNGVERRAWSHVSGLSRRANIDLLVVLPTNSSYVDDWDTLREICSSVSLVQFDRTARATPSSSSFKSIYRKVTGFGKSPITVSPDSLQAVKGKLSNTYDVVFCFRLRTTWVWKQIQRNLGTEAARYFVDFDDIESLSTSREVPFLSDSLGRVKTALLRLEALELKALEKRVLKTADAVSICSSLDRDRLAKRRPKSTIHVVPNSYPLMESYVAKSVTDIVEIAFIGTMAYPPNVDAVLYFYRSVFPLIKKEFGDKVRLNIVGLRPVPSILALDKDPLVNVTGGVESVTPYYESADIVIAPIRFGGGTRIKILEAMSHGRAVVSTTIGAEGLDLIPGDDLLLADDKRSFAAQCIRLLKDDKLRHALSVSGRTRISESYDSRIVQHQLLEAVLSGTHYPV